MGLVSAPFHARGGPGVSFLFLVDSSTSIQLLPFRTGEGRDTFLFLNFGNRQDCEAGASALVLLPLLETAVASISAVLCTRALWR